MEQRSPRCYNDEHNFMAAALEFVLNGRPVSLEGVSPNTTLLEFLRARGLTGTKEGCAEGDCGACSVAIVETGANGKPTFRAVNSCLMPICLLVGREIITVEGISCHSPLSPPTSSLAIPHPVQRAMAEGFGSQCGYCTPGFICSLFEGYYRDDLRTEDELDEQLSGNLCRCTGYRAIHDAAVEAFSFRSRRGDEAENKSDNGDIFAERLKQSTTSPASTHYQSANEKFFRPTSVAELLRLKNENPEARLIAGATELGLDITKRFKKFPTLISTEAVGELKTITSTADEWRIGAAVTLTEIKDRLGKEFPALNDMLRVFGSRQIRNRATMGGNIVTASPIGDSAPVLLALDARVIMASLSGERTVPIGEFFISYRKTALQSNEILKEIIIPRGGPKTGLTRKCEWFKVSKRREMDISTVAGCFTVDMDTENIVRHARLAYGGVAALPVRALKTEAALLGKIWNENTIRDVKPILRAEFAPISDVRGSADFRRELIISLLEKFFHQRAAGILPAELNSKLQLPAGRRQHAPPHESAHKHANGEAIYTDDFAARKNALEVWPVCAPHARARILRRDASTARGMPGVAIILLAEDVPGLNDVGAIRHDEILLADKEVFYHGQIIALVVGDSQQACREAAKKIVVEYGPLPPILKIEEALAQRSFHTEPNFIRRGDVQRALAESPEILEGEFALEGQEHFYLEMQAAFAEGGEDGSMFVMSSTQHPSEVQHIVAHVLHVPVNQVVVQSPRMGGGFGGKETQAATFAALAALAAAKTRRPVRVRVNRDLDMMLTGKRHPFLAKFKVGYNAQGDLLAAKIELISNGGWSLDLSLPVTDRAVFHLDNAYYIPSVEFSGQVAKTNLASNTAFRGFGGPQGMLVIEEIMDRIARRLGKTPEEIRERNLYRGTGATNTTHYGQEIEDNRIQRVWQELKRSIAMETRRAEIAKWNTAHTHHKRGIAMTPVKFGISFTLTHLNQAGALVLIFQDGTVQVNHGATEMGQGVHTNIAMVAGKELGVPLENVRVMPTSTDKVPNTSATAASCGTDLNGMAVKNACEILRGRLVPVAHQLLGDEMTSLQLKQNQRLLTSSPTEGDLIFADDFVFYRAAPEVKISFAKIVQEAYFRRIGLSSTGYYRTPEIHYDREKGQGHPFLYFAVGAAVTEVEVDGFTGMTHILRTDILHDAGDSINAGVNLGQIEGGFVQGAGWLTCEELVWDKEGRLLTHSPDTYKIPAASDRPREFNVRFLENATQRQTIHGSKAVGEPPLMLAISVREAIRDAIAAFGPTGGEVPLKVPATCEAIFTAVQEQKSKPNGTTVDLKRIVPQINSP
jgi:xanthine dehydrogenase molybdopterin binding subunit/xanthine dehydrogenase small subunit